MQELFGITLQDGDWFLAAAGAIGIYALIVAAISQSKLMEEHQITTWGPVIFVRTKRWIRLLDTLARPRRLWRSLATAGVPLVLAGMLLFFLMLMLMNYIMIREPPEPGSYNAPRNILLIPGVNQYIPFVWGWIAIVVTMVVHEFSHGILCRVEGIRVKSMGALFLLAPLGAFVEPDEEELFGTDKKPAIATRSARIRILSAGVISNFVVASIVLILLFGPVLGTLSASDKVVVADVERRSSGDTAGFQKGMMVAGEDGSSLQQLYKHLQGSGILETSDGRSQTSRRLDGDPARGVMVVSTFEGSPAQAAGMPESFVITGIDGKIIENLTAFKDSMNSTVPGQIISLKTNLGTYKVNLTEKGDGTGMIGIALSGDAIYMDGVTFQEFHAGPFLEGLRSLPSRGLAGLYIFLGLPFSGVPGYIGDGFQGFSGSLSMYFNPTDWAAPLGSKIFWIADLLFWIGWINLYAGLFNCLPAVPLDGGHIFRDLVGSVFDRAVNDPARAEKMTSTVVTFLSWLIISSLLYSVIGPYLAHGIPG